MNKYKETNNDWNGFVHCSIKHLYYSDVNLEPVVLPIKKGKIFNPEYQHCYIVSWTKLNMINHYHMIKKMIKYESKKDTFNYDLINYKVFLK